MSGKKRHASRPPWGNSDDARQDVDDTCKQRQWLHIQWDDYMLENECVNHKLDDVEPESGEPKSEQIDMPINGDARHAV